MGHTHHEFDAARLPLRTRRLLAAAVGVIVLGALIGLIVFWPSAKSEIPEVLGGQSELYNGTVTDGDAGPCEGAAPLALEGDPSGVVDGDAGIDEDLDQQIEADLPDGGAVEDC